MHDFILAMKHHQEKEDIAPFVSKTLVTDISGDTLVKRRPKIYLNRLSLNVMNLFC